MEVFLAQFLNGLALGSIYVLLVTGFNLLLLVARIIHFAFPHIVVFSMYISWTVLGFTGNNMFLGMLTAVLVSLIVIIPSAALLQYVMRRRDEVDINATFVMSLGMGMIVTDVLSHEFNKGFPISFPGELTGATLFRLGLVTMSRGQIYALVVGIIAVTTFFLILYRTRLGRAFRAIAEDPARARLMGLPLLKTGLYSYALAGLLGGITAVLLSMLLGSASAGLGEAVALKVLAVAITAGLGNLIGGLLCGLSLGVAESMAMGYIPGSWSNAVAFVAMLVVILAKPQGLFGTKL